MLTRWKVRGLSERAALDSLQEAGLPILNQAIADLVDYSKLSFSGAVPLSGKVGTQAASIIGELAKLGAIPPIPTSGPKVKGKLAT